MTLKKMGFLVITILLLTFSCSKNDPTVSQRTNNVASSDDPWAEWKPIPGKDYTMTIASNTMGPVDNENGPIMKWYKEQTGLKVHNISLEQANYMELLNLRIAAGEAPDVFMINNHTSYRTFYDQGILLEFEEELFKTLAPNVYALYQEEAPNSIKYAKINKDHPTLMSALNTFQGHSKFVFPNVWRKDWLKNVGINKTPDTFAELEDALYKFAKNDPDGNGRNDTYGISTSGLRTVFGYYGGMPGVISGDYRDDDTWLERDGKLVNSAVFPEMKEALRVLAKWYADGVIDPEFITSENKGGRYDIAHAFLQGRIGLTTHAHSVHWSPVVALGLNYMEFAKVYPDDTASRLEFTLPILAKDGVSRNSFKRCSIMPMTFLFNADLNDEKDKFGKILEFYNFIYGSYDDYIIAWYGFQGEHWDNINGVPTPLGKYAAGNDVLNQIGAFSTVATVIEPGKLQRPVRGKYFDWAESLKLDGPNTGFETQLPTATASSSLYTADLQKLQKETYINIITGRLPIDAFDTFVNDWYARGGKTLEDEATAWFKEFQSK